MDDLLELIFELVLYLIEAGINSSDKNKKAKRKSKNYYKTNLYSKSSWERINEDRKTNKEHSKTVNMNDKEKDSLFVLPKPDKEIVVNQDSVVKANKLVDEALHVTPTSDAIILQVMLLTYMVYEDDGRIDFKERAIIKEQLSKHAHLLSDRDIMEIRRNENMLISINSIRAYIKHSNITGMSVTKAISFLKEIERESNKYHQIISRIESSLIDVMGF